MIADEHPPNKFSHFAEFYRFRYIEPSKKSVPNEWCANVDNIKKENITITITVRVLYFLLLVNFQAVGRDSRISFKFGDFLENVFSQQVTKRDDESL